MKFFLLIIYYSLTSVFCFPNGLHFNNSHGSVNIGKTSVNNSINMNNYYSEKSNFQKNENHPQKDESKFVILRDVKLSQFGSNLTLNVIFLLTKYSSSSPFLPIDDSQ